MDTRALLFGAVILLGGCALTNQHLVKVQSTPPDALISAQQADDQPAKDVRKVAGSTPLEKKLEFPADNRLRLQVEKRGYVAQTVEVTPDSGTVSVTLQRMKDSNGQDAKEYAVPPIRRLLVPAPDFELIKRGFASEAVSADDSRAASEALAAATSNAFSERFEVVSIPASADDMRLLKAVWRDGRTAMELVDPIRLKYLPTAPYLETKSARDAVTQLGARHQGEAVLLVSGRQSRETAGLMLGKVGLSLAQTGASYGAGYNMAVSTGSSWFLYHIATPDFTEGTLLRAALIDCTSGEILWVNRGLWGTIDFADPEDNTHWTADLFAGLK